MYKKSWCAQWTKTRQQTALRLHYWNISFFVNASVQKIYKNTHKSSVVKRVVSSRSGPDRCGLRRVRSARDAVSKSLAQAHPAEMHRSFQVVPRAANHQVHQSTSKRCVLLHNTYWRCMLLQETRTLHLRTIFQLVKYRSWLHIKIHFVFFFFYIERHIPHMAHFLVGPRSWFDKIALLRKGIEYCFAGSKSCF